MNLTIVGCGWFGRALALRGVELGWQVRGSVRDAARASALREEGIAGFCLDLSDVHYPDTPFQDALVVVAVPSLSGAGQGALYESGVLRLVDHARVQGTRGLALISSTSVYEGFSGEVTELTHPQDTERVLVRVERSLADARLPTCAVRFGGLIGSDRHPGRFLAGRRDLRNGDHPVNLVRRVDCVAAVERLLLTPPEGWPGCVNVVAPEHPTRAAFYGSAAEQLGVEAPTFLPASSGGGRIVRCGWLDSQGFAFSGLKQ